MSDWEPSYSGNELIEMGFGRDKVSPLRAATGGGSSRLVEDLRASLARPLTNQEKIQRAFQAATTDEERAAIRELAMEEQRYAGSKGETIALLNATGVLTDEQEQGTSPHEPTMPGQREADQLPSSLPISPPDYEAPAIAAQLDALPEALRQGYVSAAQFSQRHAELTAELVAARERDGQLRADYNRARATGSWAPETHPALRGTDAPADGHLSYDQARAGVRAFPAGSALNPGLRAVVDGSGGYDDAMAQAGSKRDVMAAIRQHGEGVGLVTEDW